MALQVEVHPTRGDHSGPRIGCAEGQGERRHRDRMRIVRVHDLRFPLPDDARELPRRREIDLVARRQRDEIRSFRRAAIERALGMRHQDRPVAEGAQAEDGQEDLVLSAAPGAGGVDVECEHSSHSFANLSPT